MWIRGVWEGGVLRMEGEGTLRITVEMEDHALLSIAIGRKVFDAYNVSLRGFQNARVMGMMCELFDSISSRLCLVYDLEAR